MAQESLICWNGYEKKFLESFYDSFCQGEFTDVTLAVENEIIKAHRIVLSICSPFFRKMFLEMSGTSLFLKDVKANILKDLIQFMYCGKVKIKNETLFEFITTAESLKIEGIPMQCQDQYKNSIINNNGQDSPDFISIYSSLQEDNVEQIEREPSPKKSFISINQNNDLSLPKNPSVHNWKFPKKTYKTRSKPITIPLNKPILISTSSAKSPSNMENFHGEKTKFPNNTSSMIKNNFSKEDSQLSSHQSETNFTSKPSTSFIQEALVHRLRQNQRSFSYYLRNRRLREKIDRFKKTKPNISVNSSAIKNKISKDIGQTSSEASAVNINSNSSNAFNPEILVDRLRRRAKSISNPSKNQNSQQVAIWKDEHPVCAFPSEISRELSENNSESSESVIEIKEEPTDIKIVDLTSDMFTASNKPCEMEKAEFTQTNRGTRKLIYRGFAFYLSRPSIGNFGKSIWVCSNARTNKCPSVINTEKVDGVEYIQTLKRPHSNECVNKVSGLLNLI